MGGKLTLPGGAFYHATKHAVEAMSDALRFEVRPFGIDVVVVEPGPIKTRFGDTAISGMAALTANAASPYAAFNKSLAEQIRNAYEGPMAAFAAPPEAVARVIERAVASARPKTRYKVTLAARALMATRRWLPDRAFDAFLRTQFRTA
jgi:short-subunit dehydrogenase